MKQDNKNTYSAKTGYNEESAIIYEKRKHYRGLLGKFRKYRERKAISNALSFVKKKSKTLDCPCGNGRWFKLLSQKAELIIGQDISEGMVKFAKKEAQNITVDTDISTGDAENLLLEDKSVDYTFSFALMKHLPYETQKKVLSEFSRVSKKGVVCSFALFNKLAYLFWKMRNKDPESYPVWKKDLEKVAGKNDLKITNVERLTPVLGLECVVRFQKIR